MVSFELTNRTMMKAFVFIFLTVCLISCVKHYGCTDYDADNFDVSAELEDNSCIYTKGIYYHWDYETALDWYFSGFDSINIAYNKKYEASISKSRFFEYYHTVRSTFYDLPQILNIRITATSEDSPGYTTIHQGFYAVDNMVGVSKLNISN